MAFRNTTKKRCWELLQLIISRIMDETQVWSHPSCCDICFTWVLWGTCKHIFLCKLDCLKIKVLPVLGTQSPQMEAWLPQVWIVILAVVVLLVECSFFSQAVHTFHPWRLLCAIIHSSLSNNANCHHKQMPTYENISPPFSSATIRVLMISPDTTAHAGGSGSENRQSKAVYKLSSGRQNH